MRVLMISKEKEALLRNLDSMSDEEGNAAFMGFWNYALLGSPATEKPFVALAGAHKARIRWPAATKKMVKASKTWLLKHGYVGLH